MNEFKRYQNYAKASGLFFLLAIVAGVLGVVSLKGLDTLDTDLTVFSANETRNLLGALLILIMGFNCLIIAIPLYPVLKKYNEPMALSAVAFRIIETTTHVIVVLCYIGFLTLSKDFVDAGAPVDSFHHVLNSVIYNVYEANGEIGGMFFNLGFLMYAILFYKSKLIPRWLSIIGLIGSSVGFLNQILTFFKIYSADFFLAAIPELPTIVFELIIGFWLIFKGFDSEIPQKLITESK